SSSYRSKGSGRIRLHLRTMRASGSLELTLAESLPLSLEFESDREQVTLTGREAGTISTITPFVDLFGLDPDIQRWITDYLKGSRYELKTLRTSFPWDKPLQFLDTLYAEVMVDDCEYTFAPGLEAIKTDYTDVVFKKGVLAITPHDSTFYGQAGEDSWLDIDFNDPDNIILTAYILTHAVANEDILKLLQYYDVSLPFKQTGGTTESDLTLAINLNREELTARGSFLLDEGEIEYEKKRFGVKDGRVHLDDASVELEQLRVSFGEIFVADIGGRVDLARGVGGLDIGVQEFTAKVGGSSLTLDPSQPKPSLTYQIRPKQESISATASAWIHDGLALHLAPFSMDFSFADLSGVLPRTGLSLVDRAELEISGPFSIKGQRLDFQCDLLHYNFKDLVLVEKPLPLTLQYDKGLSVRSHKESRWSLNKVPIRIHPSRFRYRDPVFSIVGGRMSYGQFFDSRVSGKYNYQDGLGTFLLEGLQIGSEKHGSLLSPAQPVSLAIENSGERFLARIPDLGIEVSTGEVQGWAVRLHDLGLLYEHSELLRQYMVEDGRLTVSSAGGGKPLVFWADIRLPHFLLVQDDMPIDRFVINGEFSQGTMGATVNSDLTLLYDGRLTVSSNGIGYNIPAILNYLEERPKPSSPEPGESEGFNTSLVASNSSLFFSPDSQAPADRIQLHSTGETIKLELEHGVGTIVVDIEGDEFSLLGDKLNDVFMNSLSMDASLQGGMMSVAAHGHFDEFSALVRVDNTVLRDYKTLNNVLAFVNTIPALITFSLPDYDSRGLPVTSAVAGMKVMGGLVDFESMDVDSPELGIAGSGWIDLVGKRLDMDLNLITQSKVNVRKIPLIGFILAGEEKHPSATFKVTGDLLDPKVESEMFREVVTVPFSILFRTLALPAHLVAPILGGEEKGGEKEGRKGEE
ncbi:MAG: AsmA-like C-terminal domain-containing protein, partial [Thermodesulfobacteriota bacterium]